MIISETDYLGSKHLKTAYLLVLLMLLFPNTSFSNELERNYLLLEASPKTDSGERVISFGGFGFTKKMYAHLNLSYLDSDNNAGQTVGDVGLGLAYQLGLTFFGGGGIMLGYHFDKDNLINAFTSGYYGGYYPEVGIAAEFSRNFGIIVSGRRIYNLYQQTENVILFGLLLNFS